MLHLRQAREPQSGRIKELEEEIRRLTMENVRVKGDLEKAQRRWERLKEGARRRRREGTAEENEEAMREKMEKEREKGKGKDTEGTEGDEGR